MNEQPSAPMLPPPSGVSQWFSIWRDALTRPSEQTFARIAQSPNAKLTTALLWVFLGSLVNILLGSLLQGIVFRQMMRGSDFGFPRMAGGSLVGVICGAPVAAVISVVLFAAVVGVVQLIAKMFGGRGTFDQLAYAIAAIVAPFSLINSLFTLLAAIPYVVYCAGLVSFLLLLYVVVLEVMAVKGVNQFGWGQAAASLLLPIFVLVCCLAVGVFGVISLLAPRVSDIFNSLPTPSP
ncbi:MAG TPA: YIP1 family protein [Anaerolineales bacterium]|nr:YIP1 family protein [Anaerolineales bacterium]HLO31298.1 YIP1 family protein [Anaerolineales bacterium]